jgi:hypothetical protein
MSGDVPRRDDVVRGDVHAPVMQRNTLRYPGNTQVTHRFDPGADDLG